MRTWTAGAQPVEDEEAGPGELGMGPTGKLDDELMAEAGTACALPYTGWGLGPRKGLGRHGPTRGELSPCSLGRSGVGCEHFCAL